MIIGEVTGTSQTFGGYVNVSRQLIDFSNPSAMDLIISDLAQQYALQTENDACDTFLAAATAAGVEPRHRREHHRRRLRRRSGVLSARCTQARRAPAVSSPPPHRRCSACSARCSRS